MSATETPSLRARRQLGPTLVRAARSEALKLRSLRSQVVLLAVGALFMLVLGPIQALGPAVDDGVPGPETLDAAVSLVLSGTSTAAILFGVLGVLSVASEYSRRSIRITLTALPRRSHVVLGKATALVAIALLVLLPSAVAAMEIGRRILGVADVDLAWGDPGVLRAVLAAAWLATGWAVLGQALAWIFRSAIGAAFALLGLMFVLPALVQLLLGPRVVAILPSEAGVAMLRLEHLEGALSPAAGAVVWLAYLVAGLAVSVTVTARRDH